MNAIRRKFEIIASTVVRLTFVNVPKYRKIASDDFVVVTQMRNNHLSFLLLFFVLFYYLFIYLFIKVVDRSYRRQRICRHYHSLASYTTLVMKSLWIQKLYAKFLLCRRQKQYIKINMPSFLANILATGDGLC